MLPFSSHAPPPFLPSLFRVVLHLRSFCTLPAPPLGLRLQEPRRGLLRSYPAAAAVPVPAAAVSVPPALRRALPAADDNGIRLVTPAASPRPDRPPRRYDHRRTPSAPRPLPSSPAVNGDDERFPPIAIRPSGLNVFDVQHQRSLGQAHGPRPLDLSVEPVHVILPASSIACVGTARPRIPSTTRQVAFNGHPPADLWSCRFRSE